MTEPHGNGKGPVRSNGALGGRTKLKCRTVTIVMVMGSLLVGSTCCLA